MPGQKHQIEMTTEPNTLRIRLNPSDPPASWSSPSNFKHGYRGVDANDNSTICQPCRQLAGPTPKIENGLSVLRELQAAVKIRAPLVLQIVESRQFRILV